MFSLITGTTAASLQLHGKWAELHLWYYLNISNKDFCFQYL